MFQPTAKCHSKHLYHLVSGTGWYSQFQCEIVGFRDNRILANRRAVFEQLEWVPTKTWKAQIWIGDDEKSYFGKHSIGERSTLIKDVSSVFNIKCRRYVHCYVRFLGVRVQSVAKKTQKFDAQRRLRWRASGVVWEVPFMLKGTLRGGCKRPGNNSVWTRLSFHRYEQLRIHL